MPFERLDAIRFKRRKNAALKLWIKYREIVSMHYRGRGRIFGALFVAVLPGWAAVAQTSAPEDANIDPVRSLPSIGAADQRVIADWVQAKLGVLSAEAAKDADAAMLNGRKVFGDLFTRNGNTPAFQAEFTKQSTEAFATQLGKVDINPAISRPIARILADLNRAETVPALIAGLKSKDAPTRFMSARALAAQRSAISADKAELDRVVAAIRQASAEETSPVVVSQFYAIMSLPQQAALVFDPMLGIMEMRLESRRATGMIEDGAELEAYEFFRTPGVVAGLTPDQKSRLVNALAGFLRFDAERYHVPRLTTTEIDALTRCLDAIESILADMGLKGGDIRNELSSGGHERRAEVLNQARLWIGDKEGNKPGGLNAAPYNVPLGAM